MPRRFLIRMLFLTILSPLLWMPTSSAVAIDCDTLPPRPVIQFDSIASFNYGGGNDCWGWVAPDGTEYAIYGASNGLAFINVTTLTQADFVTGTSCTWRDIKTYRHYCYEVSECGTGLKIIDMSFLPDSVRVVTTFSPGVSCHNLNIDTARGFAYLVRPGYNGFRVISLANPESPAEFSGVGTFDMHDMYARNDTVWAAEGNGHSFSIWDMTNKSQPTQIGFALIPGNGYVHNIWPTADGRYVATTEETAFRTVKIWNTENLGNISLVAEYLAPSNLAHNAHIDGNYLFISHYQSGVAVVDIRYPECPAEVARFDTYKPGESPGFQGCWGVYPHAGTGHIYASTIEGNLMVFETDIQNVNFAATPTIGSAPLSVDFTNLSAGTILSQVWDFGDGDTSTASSPTHVYQAGVYSVQLEIETTTGSGQRIKPDFVTALAETTVIGDVSGQPTTQVAWDIDLTNHVPITELIIPVKVSQVPTWATLDSLSRVGTRTAYFEQQQNLFNNKFFGEMVVRLNANNGGGAPPLPAGSGTVLRVWMTLKSVAPAGETITLSNDDTLSGLTLTGETFTTTFAPVADAGILTILTPPCDCPCHADPVCDAISDVFDVVAAVDVAFRASPGVFDPACPNERTDVTCDGLTNVFDVIRFVDVAFRSVDPATAFCDPCLP